MSYPIATVGGMLEFRSLLTTGWAAATAVRCPGGHTAEEPVTTSAIVLLRRGVFVRHVAGRATLADVTTGYLQRPGETQRISHPHGGDVCTTLTISPELADRFAHAGPIHVSPAADLLHRRLLAAPPQNPPGLPPDPSALPPDLATLPPARADPPSLPPARANTSALPPDRADLAALPPDRADLAAELLSALLPASRATRWAHPVVEGVRELLHTDPALGLTELAASAGWSPWHLSRAFHQVTGCTLSAYRRRLRVRAALDDLVTDPSTALAGVAARAGFADQSHMTRAIRAETGTPPAALRRHLTSTAPPAAPRRPASTASPVPASPSSAGQPFPSSLPSVGESFPSSPPFAASPFTGSSEDGGPGR